MILSPTLPMAGTVVVLRDGAHGIEALLMRRPDHGSFAGGWAFPGGKVEASDVVENADDLVAERETARRAAIRETEEEVGLRIDSAVAISRWHPPAHVPVRIRTWFFVAADPGGELTLSADEVADTAWMTPEKALARHTAGEIVLFPPTWVTLNDLCGAERVEDVLAHARQREEHAPLFVTQLREQPEGQLFVWQGDEEHDVAGAAGARHRLQTWGLPWRYERA